MRVVSRGSRTRQAGGRTQRPHRVDGELRNFFGGAATAGATPPVRPDLNFGERAALADTGFRRLLQADSERDEQHHRRRADEHATRRHDQTGAGAREVAESKLNKFVEHSG